MKTFKEFLMATEGRIVVNNKLVPVKVGDKITFKTKQGSDVEGAAVTNIKNAEVFYTVKGKTRSVPINHIKSLTVTEAKNPEHEIAVLLVKLDDGSYQVTLFNQKTYSKNLDVIKAFGEDVISGDWNFKGKNPIEFRVALMQFPELAKTAPIQTKIPASAPKFHSFKNKNDLKKVLKQKPEYILTK